MNSEKAIYAKAEQAFAQHQTDAPVIAVKYNELGFWPIYTQAAPEALNDDDCTPEIVEAAIMGSMFGWHTPGAKPARDYIISKSV